MIYIQEVKGREILESRGLPTVEVEITLSNGQKAIASSPSGTSYGTDEAVEIRDKDMGRYHGYGVTRAINKVNKIIAPRLYKKDPQDQFEIDELINELDGTPNKANLGANTILAVSMTVAKVGALSNNLSFFEYLHHLYKKQHEHLFNKENEFNNNKQEMELAVPIKNMEMPEPIFNVINGRDSENSKLDVQDFMVILKGIPNFTDKLRYASEIDHQIQKNLSGGNYYFTSLSNEGGNSPDVPNDKKALQIITEAISQLEKLSGTVYYGLDVASTGLYDSTKNTYLIKGKKKAIPSSEMIDYLIKYSEEFPVIFYEDGLSATDYKGWQEFRKKVPSYMGIVGDDLFNSNLKHIERNKKEKWANGISIKPNQIGSVLDILNAIIFSQQQGLKIVISHRSGETNDDYLSDLAVAVGAEYIKAGAPKRGERVAKYNRLLRIQEELEIIKRTEN